MSIYHIAKESDFLACFNQGRYEPLGLQKDGFIHCSLEISVIPVANDYFGGVREKLLVLKIEPDRLTSPIKYEEAMPEKDANTSHLASSPIFPHIYGPIAISAIEGIGRLNREEAGYVWPDEFMPLVQYLRKE